MTKSVLVTRSVIASSNERVTVAVSRDDEESRLAIPINVLREAITNNYAISPPIRIGEEEDPAEEALALKKGGVLLAFKSGRLARWRENEGIEDLAKSMQGGLTGLTQRRNGEIISASSNGDLTAWRWRNSKLEAQGNPEPSGQVKVTRILELVNSKVVSSGSDGSLQLWELQDGHFRRLGERIDASSGNGPISGMIDLENGEIATAADSEVMLWRFKDYGRTLASLEKVSSGKNRFWYAANMLSPNNFIAFGKGKFVYPVNPGAVYIGCEGGSKYLLSSSERQGLNLRYRSFPLGGNLICRILQEQMQLVRDGVETERTLVPQFTGSPSAVLWLGGARFIVGDGNGYITFWNGSKPETSRLPSSHISVRKLIRLANGEIVSLGANDVSSPSYFGYGWGDFFRRWRDPHAQMRIIESLQASRELRDILELGCASIDLSSVAPSDPLSKPADSAKRMCRKIDLLSRFHS
jgi:WD40 repeat protein